MPTRFSITFQRSKIRSDPENKNRLASPGTKEAEIVGSALDPPQLLCNEHLKP